MSTGAGISDYLTSPASLAGARPTTSKSKTGKSKTDKSKTDKSKTDESTKVSKYRQQRDSIVIDGRVKKVVTQFTEEGGVIHQVKFYKRKQSMCLTLKGFTQTFQYYC
jgi:hypothetical protein